MIDKKGDVGFIEDAITTLLNLVHVEEHSINSFFMTNDPEWLEINNEARKDRTELLTMVTYHENSQIYCWNKHTFTVILGYRELANRLYSEGRIKEATEYYTKSSKWLGMYYYKNKIEGGDIDDNAKHAAKTTEQKQ